MYTMGLSSLLVLASNRIDFNHPKKGNAVYRIQDLGVGLYPNRINNSGTVVGILVGRQVETEAFVWNEETGRQLLTLDSEARSFANDISDSGLVVGHIGERGGSSKAYSWMSRNPEFDFSPFDEGQSVAYGVNLEGHMVGQIGDSALSNYEAFRYEPVTGIRRLGTLGGNLSQATALNDRGEVVGWSVTGEKRTHAFVWREGTGMVDLGTLGGTRSLASAINSRGTIVGQAETSDRKTRAALFENGTVENLGALGDGWSLASDINDQGIVVGQSESGQPYVPQFARKAFDLGSRFLFSRIPHERSRAVRWENGQLCDLNTLTPEGQGWDTLSAATGVNDYGQIVGFGKKNGLLHGFLLTPVGFENRDETLTVTLNTDFLSAN